MLVFCAIGALAGCSPALTTSEKAADWPLQRDAAPAADGPSGWPGWRGGNASGIGTGRPPIEFGPETAVRWKATLPGRGHSSPVIFGDVVLLTTAVGDEDQPDLFVLCIDRAAGTIRWQAPAGKAHGRTHAKNGYASPTVATDGQRVFAFFGAAGLFGFDMAGQRLWHVEFDDLDHEWGFGGSPVLFGDMVIVVCDGEQEAFVAAFDQYTGRERWRTDRPSRGSWSTPVFVTADAEGAPRVEMVVNGTTREPSGDGLVIAYDPHDGAELWRVRGTETFVTPTTLVCNGLVYSLSGRNGPIMAVEPGGNGDVTDGRTVWKTSRGGPYIPSAVAYRQRLFVLGDAGGLVSYNAGSGRQIWTARLRGSFTASLVAADGRVYAVSEAGVVYVFAAEDEYQSLARNELGEKCLATPAIVDGDIFLRTATTLYCFAGEASGEAVGGKTNGKTDEKAGETTDKKAKPVATPAEKPRKAAKPGDAWPLMRGDGRASGVAASTLPERLERLWTFSVDYGGFEGTAAIVEGMVYAGDTDGKVYKLALADGAKQWEFDTESFITSSPSVRGESVFIGDADGRFYCLDAATGRPRWKFTADAEIDGGANFHEDCVLFGSQDANLYCLKAADGTVVWKYESGDQIRCFPTIVGGQTFVAGCDGRLHVIRLSDGQSVGDVDLASPTGSTPAVLGDRVFVGTEGNEFLAIDWKEKTVAWRYENPQRANAFRSSAAVTPELVVVGSRDKLVYAFDPNSGEVRWRFAAKSAVDGSPAVVGQRVFIGASDGRLYELDLKTGQERWRFEGGGDFLGSPAVAEGRLVIGNDRGDLFCFGLPTGSAR